MNVDSDWFFTAPLEASSVRRGDPLGMRVHAEEFVEVLGGAKPFERLRLLSAFCQLADAGVAAMNACWRMVRDGDGTGFARAADVVASSEVSSALEVLAVSARRWQREVAKERGTSRRSALQPRFGVPTVRAPARPGRPRPG